MADRRHDMEPSPSPPRADLVDQHGVISAGPHLLEGLICEGSPRSVRAHHVWSLFHPHGDLQFQRRNLLSEQLRLGAVRIELGEPDHWHKGFGKRLLNKVDSCELVWSHDFNANRRLGAPWSACSWAATSAAASMPATKPASARFSNLRRPASGCSGLPARRPWLWSQAKCSSGVEASAAATPSSSRRRRVGLGPPRRRAAAQMASGCPASKCGQTAQGLRLDQVGAALHWFQRPVPHSCSRATRCRLIFGYYVFLYNAGHASSRPWRHGRTP
jgi:hypothetical protein